MNIKPTKKKMIWTPIIALAINVIVPLVNWFTTSATWSFAQKYMNYSNSTGLFQPANITTLTTYMYSKWNIIVFIVELILIYLVWSLLFQKSKRFGKHPINLNQK
jgi:hypothetical protein